LGIRRETVQNSRRFLVAALLGMTRGRKLLGMTRARKLLGMARARKLLARTGRSKPRNVPFPPVIPNALTPLSFRTPILPCHSERPSSRVIPNVVRNPQLGIQRETVQNSRRFLVAALLGMTRNCKLLGMRRGRKLLGMTRDCKLLARTRGRCAPRNDRKE
jgi:hypothetical protein